MNDRTAFRAPQDNVSVVEIEAAARRLMSALDALEGAVEERNDTDRSEDELAATTTDNFFRLFSKVLRPA